MLTWCNENLLHIAENERIQMNDFATQDIAAIAAPAAQNVDANVTITETTAETQLSGVQIANALAASSTPQPAYPEAAANAAVATDAVSQTVTAAVVPMPVSKQAQRVELGGKFVPVRCGIESQASAAVNEKHSTKYKGTFEARLDNPNEVTAKTLEKLCSSGSLFFMPNDANQYPALKKICDTDGEVNLSALMTKAKRPANIDDTSWRPLEQMWNDASKTLRIDGLAPMHMLIARVLAEKGLGGPKISKKLGGSSNAGTGHKHEAMCQVLDNLNELLMKTKATE